MTDTGKEGTVANQESANAPVPAVAANTPERVDEPAEARRGEEQDWAELCRTVSWSQARYAVPPPSAFSTAFAGTAGDRARPEPSL